MRKLTLLELTQKVLRSVGGDEVNSISDTVESSDVVDIIEDTYMDMYTRIDAPERFDMVQLQASGDTAKPVTMSVPSNIDTVLWVKYNTKTPTDTDDVWDDVKWLEPKDFLDLVLSYQESATNIISYTAPNGTKLYCYNDVGPKYYTSFDDRNIVFDAYDASVDSTLQASKTQCYGTKIPTFTRSDSFVPDLDANLFPLLLNEAKATAWAELKQSTNARVEKSAKKHWIHQQKSKQNVRGNTLFENRPNYGRR